MISILLKCTLCPPPGTHLNILLYSATFRHENEPAFICWTMDNRILPDQTEHRARGWANGEMFLGPGVKYFRAYGETF